ncbi:MAG: hypothetical protein WAV21_01970 [Minisyncoccia bacterium]
MTRREKTLSALVVVLVLIVIWFGATIVRLENYHYAVQVGMCGLETTSFEEATKRESCLTTTETRTSSFAHIWYALSGS